MWIRIFIIFLGVHTSCLSTEFTRETTACVGSKLWLRCPPKSTIKILSVRLSDSNCYFRSCCPDRSGTDCSIVASDEHRSVVHTFCNAHESCTFDVKEEKAPCGYIFSSYSDYENVTWKCIETPTTTTTSTITTTTSMFDLNINTNIDGVTKKAFEKASVVDAARGFDEARTGRHTDGSKNAGVNAQWMVVLVIAGLVILIITIIISLTCIITRRIRLEERKLNMTVGNGLDLPAYNLGKLYASDADTYDFIGNSTDSAFGNDYLNPNNLTREKKDIQNAKKFSDDNDCDDCGGDGGFCSSSGGRNHGIKDHRISNLYSKPYHMVAKANDEDML